LDGESLTRLARRERARSAQCGSLRLREEIDFLKDWSTELMERGKGKLRLGLHALGP
jgi:hypothetical protein